LTRLHNLRESKLNKIVRAILNCDLTSKQREEVKLIVNKKVLVEEKEAWALKHGIWKMQSER
jgi:hypothetical protein